MDQINTYKKSWVDIESRDKLLERIIKLTKNLPKNGLIGGIRSFVGAIELLGYREPTLISVMDGFETKLKIDFILNKHNIVGIDLIVMCENDIGIIGAKPLLFFRLFCYWKTRFKNMKKFY